MENDLQKQLAPTGEQSMGDKLFDKATDFIKSVGIPAAIAFYVLMRLEPAINANTKAISELTLVVARIATR